MAKLAPPGSHAPPIIHGVAPATRGSRRCRIRATQSGQPSSPACAGPGRTTRPLMPPKVRLVHRCSRGFRRPGHLPESHHHRGYANHGRGDEEHRHERITTPHSGAPQEHDHDASTDGQSI